MCYVNSQRLRAVAAELLSQEKTEVVRQYPYTGQRAGCRD